MDKKATSKTGVTADSSDSYWLACIAYNRQNDLTEKTEGLGVRSKKPIESPAIPIRPATKNYPRTPADSFWLKQPDSRHQTPAAPDVAAENLMMPQGDARVSLPVHIGYTAIIDDGQTHHIAWSIRNMSLSGVLLEMDISHLREGLAVYFLLRYTHKGRTTDRRVPAKVVRTQLNGLALQFSHYDTVTYHELARLLYSA